MMGSVEVHVVAYEGDTVAFLVSVSSAYSSLGRWCPIQYNLLYLSRSGKSHYFFIVVLFHAEYFLNGGFLLCLGLSQYYMSNRG